MRHADLRRRRARGGRGRVRYYMISYYILLWYIMVYLCYTILHYITCYIYIYIYTHVYVYIYIYTKYIYIYTHICYIGQLGSFAWTREMGDLRELREPGFWHFSARFSRGVRRLRESPQYSLAVFRGRMTVSANKNARTTINPGWRYNNIYIYMYRERVREISLSIYIYIYIVREREREIFTSFISQS